MMHQSFLYPQGRSAAAPRSGITLIESLIATLLLAGVLASALQVAALSGTMQVRSTQRSIARFLAAALANDISQLPYSGPGNAPFGRAGHETATSKVNYDDVDDFDGWSESPPQDRAGVALPGMSGYTRSVTVAYVDPLNIGQVSATDTGAKRIIVTVMRGNTTLATCTIIRTKAP